MFVNKEIDEIERVGRALARQPLLRAAFESGGLSYSRVRALIAAEELERGFAEPSSAGAHGDLGSPSAGAQGGSTEPRGSASRVIAPV